MKITDYAHLLIKEHLKSDSFAIDATCGNGHDTLFLAKLVPNGKVLAYDIQEKAINKTKELCQDYTNITYNLASFTTIYPKNCDLVLFNLGYLPNGDKTITTKCDDTLEAFKNLFSSFDDNPHLLLICCIYPVHLEGLKESQALDCFCQNLDAKAYLVMKIKPFNQTNAPYILTIQKK